MWSVSCATTSLICAPNRPSSNKGKNMNKHTPTPWHVGELNGSGIQICHSDNSPGAISKNLAVVTARQTWLKEAEANAAHIVRCVNSHDALVAQMINALELIELLRANSSDRVVVENTQLAPMYAALAAAGAPQ